MVFKKGYVPWNKGRTQCSKGLLQRLCVDEKRSLKEIAEKLGYSSPNILLWLNKYGIPRRRPGGTFHTVNPVLKAAEPLAYILGVLAGDGSAYRGKTGRKYPYQWKVVLSIRGNPSFAQAFQNALEKIGLHPKVLWDNSSSRWICYAYSKAFVEWYKSLSLEEIEDLISEKPEFMVAFIRGFYESDGTAGQYTINICNTKKKLLETAERLMRKLGFSPRLSRPYYPKDKKRKTYYKLRLHRIKQIERFMKIVQPCIKRWNPRPYG